MYDAASDDKRTTMLVVGAGPAGLTAAIEAVGLGVRPIVVERDACVGGIARTESFKGYHFDMGGHRFFTRLDWINAWWRDMLGADFIRRPRLSRIYYRNKYFAYPPDFANAVRGLGLVEGARIAASYVMAQIFPRRPVVSFRDWVSNNFGVRLFEMFFDLYRKGLGRIV